MSNNKKNSEPDPELEPEAEADPDAVDVANAKARNTASRVKSQAGAGFFGITTWASDIANDVVLLFSDRYWTGQLMNWVIRKTLIEPPQALVITGLIFISISASLAILAAPMWAVRGAFANSRITDAVAASKGVRSLADMCHAVATKSLAMRILMLLATYAAAPFILIVILIFDPMTARTVLSAVALPCILLGLGWAGVAVSARLGLSKYSPANWSWAGTTFLRLLDPEQLNILAISVFAIGYIVVAWSLGSALVPGLLEWAVGHIRPEAYLGTVIVCICMAAVFAVVHLEGHREPPNVLLRPEPYGPDPMRTHVITQFLVSFACVAFLLVAPRLNRAEFARMRIMSGGTSW